MEFVNFSIAKKLKEKGFNYLCSHYYRTNSKDLFMIFPCEDRSSIEERIYVPSISQVLKWLREEKGLHIELWTVGKKPIKWHHTITTLNHVGEKQGWSSGTKEDSYEAAAIAGIEYVIDNLI